MGGDAPAVFEKESEGSDGGEFVNVEGQVGFTNFYKIWKERTAGGRWEGGTWGAEGRVAMGVVV